jgi:hypothetical protein
MAKQMKMGRVFPHQRTIESPGQCIQMVPRESCLVGSGSIIAIANEENAWLCGECQVVLFWERLAIILVGGPRVAEQDSLASLWRVKGEDWRLFRREGQGWQSKTVWQVFGESKEKIGNCSGRRAKGGRVRWFGKSLASQRRRSAIVLAGGPRVAEQDGLTSLWRV